MFGKFGVWELLIIAVIIILLFGTKKLRNVGGDIGAAMKNFKKAVKDEENNPQDPTAVENKDADFDSNQASEAVEEKSAADSKQ